MRRSNRRVPQTMFRGRELPRLLTMIVMIAVLFMLMTRARDPNTWRWLTNEPPASDSSGSELSGSVTLDEARSSMESEQLVLSGPPELDPEEADAAREEFQAITDKTPMQKEEMPAYWRLLRWVKQQPPALLQGRARKDLLFTDLVEVPDKYRGKPVHLRLHLMQVLSYETDDSPIGTDRLYEARGWTDESNPWPYIVVFADRPSGMPIGRDVREEASFDGYFFKLMSYEAHDGKTRFAPVLLGRLVWHPVRQNVESNSEWMWSAVLLGGLLVIFMIGRWTLSYVSRRSQASASQAEGSGVSVEKWLEKLQKDEVVPDNEPSVENDGGDDVDFEPGFDRERDRDG